MWPAPDTEDTGRQTVPNEGTGLLCGGDRTWEQGGLHTGHQGLRGILLQQLQDIQVIWCPPCCTFTHHYPHHHHPHHHGHQFFPHHHRH